MSSPDEQGRRDANRSLIARFLSDVHRDIDDFFTDDAVKEIPFATFFSPDGGPMRWQGKEALRANAEANSRRIDWYEWRDVRISGTDDPDRFFVEASGVGEMTVGGVTRPYVQKEYYLIFELRDGRIALYKEIMNPLELLKTVGGEIVLPDLPPQEY